MDYRSYSEELRRRRLDNPATRCLTGIVILVLHLLIIGGTVFWGGGCRSSREPKEKIYKVKLGGVEPSHAPEVGQPERLRPTGDPAPTPPSEPAAKPLPKPTQKEPAAKPVTKPVPKEPTAKPQPKPKPKPVPKEPTAKPRPKPKTKPKPKSKPTRQSGSVREPAAKPSPQQQSRRNNKKRTSDDDGIFHPSGGSNFNPNVPIGSRDVGQVKGPADHRTPMAGKNDDAEREWGDRVGKFVYTFWSPPENVFWGGNPPEAVLELVIAADGRVLNARLVKSSGNARMDGTIQQLIRQLKGRNVPRPPGGQQTIELKLIPK